MSLVTRCDLHVHSSASVGADDWFTRRFGCPESYAPPARQYELCKARGMSLVTLTDHDTIAGGIELLGHPDFFLSEEVTARFPADGTTVHVLAWAITPAQHDGLQAHRDDLFALVDYLRAQRIPHGLAHPLLSPNWQLTAETVEKLLLLFPVLEGVNGLLDARIHDDLFELLDGFSGAVVHEAAARTGIAPAVAPGGRHVFSAGSDDHVQRRSATVWTEVDGRASPPEFFARLLAGQARTHGEPGDLNTMALGIASTAYEFLTRRTRERPGWDDPFVDLIDVVAGRKGAHDPGGRGGAFVKSLFAGAARAKVPVGEAQDLVRVSASPTLVDDTRIADGIARLDDALLDGAIADLVAGVADGDFYRVFGALRDAAGAVTTVLPFLFAADHFGRQGAQVARIRAGWRATPLAPRPERLALFSDSLEHTDGVAHSCRRFATRARAAGKTVLIPHCGALPEGAEPAHFHRIPAARTFRPPLYPALVLHVPSILSTLDWVWRERITHIELATPGPMGLVGLLCAKLLRLPVTASHHTELPELVRLLGAPELAVTAARRYVAWFLGSVDRVFAFSAASRDRLIEYGVADSRIELLPVAVDPAEFSPAHGCPDAFGPHGIDTEGRPVALSVGRVSREKNLPMVIDAVGRLQHLERPPILVIVGDGPEREALAREHRGRAYVHFVGEQRGAELRRLYASARFFVFASRIDTLGLVTLEAMASGLPVLVPADTGAAELLGDGFAGVPYPFGAPGLAAAIQSLLGDPVRAAQLADNGRTAMRNRWEQERFERVWRLMVGGNEVTAHA